MDSTNQLTLLNRLYSHFSAHASSPGRRLGLLIAVVIAVHVTVKASRYFSEWLIRQSRSRKSPLDFVTQRPKFATLTQLVASSVTFGIYFLALGLLLEELGVDMRAYLASA